MPRKRTVLLLASIMILAVCTPSAIAGDAPITFNLDPEQIVQLDDFLLVAEIGEELLGEYDQFKLLIDGKEVDSKFISEEGILTFLPGENFKVGKHRIEVIGIKSDVEEVVSNLDFGAVLKDLPKFISGELDIEDALLALGGELIVDHKKSVESPRFPALG